MCHTKRENGDIFVDKENVTMRKGNSYGLNVTIKCNEAKVREKTKPM